MNEVIGYVDTRAAEVATTAIASDVAQVHQDMLDADADAQAAAASAAAAAGTLANAVKKTGEASQSIAGDIAISGTTSLVDVAVSNTIEVPTPVNNADAASKKYVDDADALKADKTYVDAQDALKISIADINSYAVGLTGNQNPIAGDKTFTNPITILTTVANAFNGFFRKLTNMDWSSDADIPASNITIRLLGIASSSGTTIARLNLVITNTGVPRFQLEWYTMENNNRVYHSQYLNS